MAMFQKNTFQGTVVADNLSLNTPNGTLLLDSTRLVIAPGHRYGVVGRNGVGKSTLLKAIASGELQGCSRDIKTIYVHQEAKVQDKSSLQCLMDERAAVGGLAGLEAEIAELEDPDRGSEDTSESALSKQMERLTMLYDKLDQLQGPRLEEQARAVLSGLQFPEYMFDKRATQLSGGWQQRLGLAQAIFSQPDILLLDEPVNHLDLAAILWLESYLVRTQTTSLIVSHDEHFLEAVCTDVLLFDNLALQHVAGGFASFRCHQEQNQKRNELVLNIAKERESKFDAAKRQQQKAMRRGNLKSANAVEKNSNERRAIHGKASDAQGKARAQQATRRKQARARNLNLAGGTKVSIEEVREDVSLRQDQAALLAFHFDAPPLASDTNLVQLQNVSFAYPTSLQPILRDVSLTIDGKARVAIMGRNGAGKSTLLKLLVGQLQCTEGRITRSDGLQIVYVGQNHIAELDRFMESTAIEFVVDRVTQLGSECSVLRARSLLARVGLRNNDVRKAVRSLSGGQKIRLLFASKLAHRPHLLVLDEPTNHLDSESLRALCAALDAFQGAVLCVSHHRGFVESIAKQVWLVGQGEILVQHAQDRTDMQQILRAYVDQQQAG